MGAAIKYISVFALLTILSGCPDKGCKQGRKTLLLESSYKNWFADCSYDNYLQTKSIKGLTESLHESRNIFMDGMNSKPDPCIFYLSENNSLSYYSSFYNFSLNFSLIAQVDAPYLVCKIQGKYGKENAGITLKRNMLTGEGQKISVQNHNSFSDSLTDYTATFEILDTIVSGNKTYYNIYKITNDFFKYHGDNFSIVETFLDQNEGLIRFKQKNGDIWAIK
jgi:hypothetical protein